MKTLGQSSAKIKRNALLGLAIILGTGGSSAAIAESVSATPPAAAVTSEQSLGVYNQFQKYLKNSAKTPYSLIQARNYLLNNLKRADSWRATVMVLQLENAQKARLNAFSEKFFPEKVQKAIDAAYRKGGRETGLTYSSLLKYITDNSVRSLLTESYGYGYKLETSEGMYYPVMHYEGFKYFKPYIGKDIAAYIDLMAADSNKPALSDAAIIIPWNELINRTLALEAFVKAYPTSNRTAAVKEKLRLMETFVFFGSNNTPAYQYGAQGEPTIIDPELKQAYEKAVLNGAGDSSVLKTIQSVLGMLDASGDKWNGNIEKFLRDFIQNG
ncbi:hypothetical protein G5B47_00455 [Paenibacillus sp. 7124]|uniref:Uncharacterized protein n=1 Tax=Paenibacillus apii TaxID=1850370 RepID=A0A6M1PE60_9BACL|nr:hypothetical protein [Paenibacillus apii]NGM80874.1 hypothetical protein [Paenibacillus apii]NJJ40781.1 hypothetical protein [Paenibacillus apii]